MWTRRLFAFLSLAFLLIATARERLGHERQGSDDHQSGSAQKQAAPDREEQPVRPIGPDRDNTDKAEQHEHRRKERQYRKWSLVAGATSAIAALGAAFFAWSALNASWQAVTAARDQAATARRALFANDRPWVKIDSIAISAMEIDDEVVVVWAKIMVKNVGRSPAEGVYFTPYILLPDLDKDHLASMVEICQKTKTDGPAVFRALLFPDEVKNIEHGENNAIFTRFTADLTKAKEVRREEKLSGIEKHNELMRSLGQSDKQITPEAEDDSHFYTTFTLASCITYSAYAAPDIYQTTFTVNLRRAIPDWPLGGAFDTSKQGRIPLQEIIAEDPFAGDFAN